MGPCGRTNRHAAGMVRRAVAWARRAARGRGRALPVVAAGFLGRRYRHLFCPESRAAFVARLCCSGRRGGRGWGARRHPGWREAALAFTALAAGFALMRETAWQIQAPMLQRRLGPGAISGRVVDIDLVERGWRVVIEADPLPGLDAADQPRRVRVHIPPGSDELNPGDQVSLKAVLHPVPAQILPGGRDFQRELYFARIWRGRVCVGHGPSERGTGCLRRVARGIAEIAHRDDAADRGCSPWVGRRCRLGADHRKTRHDQ